jgi:hypothetical protein
MISMESLMTKALAKEETVGRQKWLEDRRLFTVCDIAKNNRGLSCFVLKDEILAWYHFSFLVPFSAGGFPLDVKVLHLG